MFSGLLWFVYTIMTGIALVGTGNVFCGNIHLPSYCGAVFAVVLAAALGGVAFLLHHFAPKLTAYAQKRKKTCLAAEVAVVVILSVLGIWFRTEGLQNAEETSAYYEMAEVAMGWNMPETSHGAVRVYVWTLHFVFLFLGNHFIYGIIAQMIFQGITVLALFFLIRKYIGRIAALVVTGFFACAPHMVQGGLSLSPDMMYLCLLAVAGAVVAVCCGRGCENMAAERESGSAFLILAGITGAVMTYLDVAGVLLLLFSIALISRAARERYGFDRKIPSVLCCVLGFVFGFVGCAAAESLAGGKGFESVLQTWFQLYQPEDFRLPVTAGIPDSHVGSLVLTGLMTLGIYSFWFDGKRERFTVCMAASCAVILAGCFGIFTPEMQETIFLYLLFLLMAGIGLQQCFSYKVGMAVSAGKLGKGRKTSKDRENLEKQAPRENNEKQTDQERQNVLEQPKKEPDVLAVKEPEEKKEIRYLENPLPLPKKHEKKVLDYDYPVADDDDFDI